MIAWLLNLTLLFGAGADITAEPTHISPGDTFFAAPKVLTPVSDAMQMGIGIGTPTVETKMAVLSGALKLSDIGDVKVSVCRSNSDCLALRYAGTYFTKKSYGFSFEGNGSRRPGHH
ncbi:MAG: hypothetical protein NVSMB6_14150 [Burkholderiaceae bacterium]